MKLFSKFFLPSVFVIAASISAVSVSFASTSASAYDEWRKPRQPTIEIFDPFQTDTAIQDFLFSGRNPLIYGSFTGVQEYRIPAYEMLAETSRPAPPLQSVQQVTPQQEQLSRSPSPATSRAAFDHNNIPDPQPIKRPPPPITPLQYSAFKDVADRAIKSLASGNPDPFIQNISPNMKTHFGEARIVNNVLTQLLPYFQGLQRLNEQARISRTVDAWGNEGFSFYQSFVTRGGETRNFLIQVVKEGNRLVIANLTPEVKTQERNLSAQRVSSRR